MQANTEQLPIILTLQIIQRPEPNDHWYEITGVLSWKEVYHQRMETGLCSEREVESAKEALQFIVSEHFDIREVREDRRRYKRRGCDDDCLCQQLLPQRRSSIA
jgi:hypothetical protein